MKTRADNHTDAGLIVGDHAYYASSLGRLYYWLDNVILAGAPQDCIEQVMLLNYHIGLRCTLKGKSYVRSLSSPSPDHNASLIGKFVQLAAKNPKGITIGACSAAVVTEGYMSAKQESIREFMREDYGGLKLTRTSFQKKVEERLAEVIQFLETKVKRPLVILRSAHDLPSTCVYIKFKKPIATVGRRKTKKVHQLFATGIYDTAKAVDVLPSDGDLEIPTQILLSEKAGSEHSKQINNLVENYKAVIENFREEDPHYVGRIFVACYREDDKIARLLINELKSALADRRFDFVLGLDLADTGDEFLPKFKEKALRCDYSISLFPKKDLPRANVIFEHGYFFRRLSDKRAVLARYPPGKKDPFSDVAPKMYIPRLAARTSKEKQAAYIAGVFVKDIL